MENSQKVIRLRRMQWFATACVFVAFMIRVTASFLGDASWVGYLKAFSEAAVIGGLADWFAVTVLFRRPFGIPLPHTEIIPRRKDELAASLADFVTENFLTTESVGRELDKMDLAAQAAGVLQSKADVMTNIVVRHGPTVLDLIDDSSVESFMKSTLSNKLHSIDFGPIVADMLEVLTSGGKGQRVMTDFLRELQKITDRNQDLMVGIVRKHLPLPNQLKLPGLPLGVPIATVKDKLAEKIGKMVVERMIKSLNEVVADPDHDIRKRIRRELDGLMLRLHEDEDMQAKVAGWRDELLDNENVSGYAGDVWSELKQTLRRDLENPQGIIRRQLEKMLLDFGKHLSDDAPLRARLNQQFRPIVIEAVVGAAPACSRVIRETVALWDGQELARKLELEVGHDLQFVRLNGTLVGGLLGLVLHTILLLV